MQIQLLVFFLYTQNFTNSKESLNNAEPCWGRGRLAREKTKD